MHSFEVHSNESACRKSGRLGLEQVKLRTLIVTLVTLFTNSNGTNNKLRRPIVTSATVFTKISGDNREFSIPILISVTDTIKSSGANKTNWIPIVTSTNTLTLFYISPFYIIMSGRKGRSPYCSRHGNSNRVRVVMS